VGARAWTMPDGGGAARTARADDEDPDGVAVDDAATPLQATQGYSMSQEDDDEEAGADEVVRRAPTWHATQQYGWSQEDDEGRDDDDEAVRRPGWSDAQMDESPRALAARWAALGLEMDDELTGESSRTMEEAECMSDVHDELLSSMDVVAVVHAQDAEGEQQSERVSVECVGRVDDGAGGGSSEARRGHAEGEGGVEQGASMAAREVEGDDEDEDMAGVENISMQRAEGRRARSLLLTPSHVMVSNIFGTRYLHTRHPTNHLEPRHDLFNCWPYPPAHSRFTNNGYRVKSSLYRNNRQPYGSLSNVLRKPAGEDGSKDGSRWR
jgi:hypothetical protein